MCPWLVPIRSPVLSFSEVLALSQSLGGFLKYALCAVEFQLPCLLSSFFQRQLEDKLTDKLHVLLTSSISS